MKPFNSDYGYQWFKNNENLTPCIEIRRIVFVEEQKVAENIVFDDYDNIDNKETLSVWVYEQNSFKSVGSARIVWKKEPKKWYIQRVSVLKEFRGKGLGHYLLDIVHSKCKEMDIKEIYVSSQNYIKELYEKNGYEQFGDSYLEADILHVSLRKEIIK